MVELDGRPGHRQHRHLREVVLMDQPDRVGDHAGHRRTRRHRGTRRDLCEVGLDQHSRGSRLEVTGDDERGVLRAVEPIVEAADVRQRGRLQVVERSDDLPAVGMIRGIEVGVDHGGRVAVGPVVVALALLVLDDLFLVLEARLVHRVDEEAEPIRLHPEHAFECVLRHHRVVDRRVVRRAAVEGAAERRDTVDEATRPDVLGVLEKQMLEQVREAGPARRLSGRPDVIEHRHRHDWVRMVLVQHDLETVVEDVVLEG